MFNSKNLFKSVPCPAGSKCQLLNCIFSHDENRKEVVEPAGGDRKRQKLEHGEKVVSKSSEPFTGRLASQAPGSNSKSTGDGMTRKLIAVAQKERSKELGGQKDIQIDSKP